MDMGKNNLISYIDDFFNDFELYGDNRNGHNYNDLLYASIIRFLEDERISTAYEVIENFFMIYQITCGDENQLSCENSNLNEPNIPLDFIKLMLDYVNKYGFGENDFLIHSTNLFILGLSIYAKNTRYQKTFEEYVRRSPFDLYYKTEDGKVSREEFLYRWGISSLLSNVLQFDLMGKPYRQILNDDFNNILNRYGENIRFDFFDLENLNSISKIDVNFIDKYINDYPFTRFLDLYKPTEILAYMIFLSFFVPRNEDILEFTQLNKKDLYSLRNDLNNFIDYMVVNDFIDNGFSSSIFVLNLYGYLIQKYDKNPDFFFYPIAHSATAILLKNYYRGRLQGSTFNLGRLMDENDPLALLLILCDELYDGNDKSNHFISKSHFRDINVEISNDEISVKYKLKNSSLGHHISYDKESILNEVLYLKPIFPKGLTVNIYNELGNDGILEDISLYENETSTIPLSHLEGIARVNHKIYSEMEMMRGNHTVSYNKLDDEKKLTYLRQAKEYPRKLNLIGCEIVSKSDVRYEHLLNQEEVHYLAKVEYGFWLEEQRHLGNISPMEAFNDKLIDEELYIDLMDKNNNISFYKIREGLNVLADLVPFDDLNSYSQERNIRPIMEIPRILDNMRLKIVDTKLKLLTIRMHDTYRDFVTDEEEIPEFMDLVFEIQQNNFKQTHFIIKFLADINYNVVAIDDEGEEVTRLGVQEIEYLAEREHNTWYLRKLNEGYVYGEEKGDMKNPKMMLWHELSWDLKEPNLHTFEKLPENLASVGLKIVKI